MRIYAAILIICLLFQGGLVFAGGVKVDVKCKDSTIKYSVEKAAVSVIEKSNNHKLAVTSNADISIRFAINTITKPENKKEIMGVSAAMMATKKTKGGHIKIVAFNNYVISQGKVEETIKNIIKEFLDAN